MAILSITSHVCRGDGQFDIIKLLDDAATGTTDAIDAREAKGISLLVESGAGVSDGVVTLEGAVSSDYSGTWVSLDTATTNSASSTFIANHDQMDDGPVPYVRARITTGITGGTVDVYMMLQK